MVLATRAPVLRYGLEERTRKPADNYERFKAADRWGSLTEKALVRRSAEYDQVLAPRNLVWKIV